MSHSESVALSFGIPRILIQAAVLDHILDELLTIHVEGIGRQLRDEDDPFRADLSCAADVVA